MSYDLVIKNGVVIDGSGMPRYRGDVGVVGRSDRGDRPHPGVRARGDRRRRPGGGARIRRRAYAHGRPGLLGPPRHLLVLARRDERGHGQLRLHARAVRQVGPASRRAKSRARGGHRERGDGRGHRLDVDHVPGVPHRRRRAAQGHQLRGLRRPLRAAHVCDGRARLRQGRDRGRSPRDGARAARGAHRGRHGLHDLAVAQPRDAGPPPRGEPRRELGRGAPARRRHGRDERRHLRDRGRALHRSRGPARLPRAPARPRRGDGAAHHVGPVQPPRGPDPLADVHRPARGNGPRRRPDVRPGAQPRAHRGAVVQDQPALRPAARLEGAARAAARGAEAPAARSRAALTPGGRRARARRAPPDRRGGARRPPTTGSSSWTARRGPTGRSPTSRGSAPAIPSRP